MACVVELESPRLHRVAPLSTLLAPRQWRMVSCGRLIWKIMGRPRAEEQRSYETLSVANCESKLPLRVQEWHHKHQGVQL